MRTIPHFISYVYAIRAYATQNLGVCPVQQDVHFGADGFVLQLGGVENGNAWDLCAGYHVCLHTLCTFSVRVEDQIPEWLHPVVCSTDQSTTKLLAAGTEHMHLLRQLKPHWSHTGGALEPDVQSLRPAPVRLQSGSRLSQLAQK